jgi:O-methyltransferase involved in polyketide biosynthesis
LAETSFEFGVPSVFSWLGVTQYITQTAIQSTLEFIQSLPRSSTVVFSFLPTDKVLGEEDRHLVAEIDRLATARGEPFVSRFDPQDLQQLLRDIGFKNVYHLLPEVAQDRYFMDRADGLTAIRAEQVMKATV